MIDCDGMVALVPQPGTKPDRQGLLDAFPWLLPLEAVMQDKVFHREGDVLTHTFMVCDAMAALPEYAKADPADRFVLFYAALFHDIAKPVCAREVDGVPTFRGHSAAGAVDARVFMWRAGVPFGPRERICSMISFHQVPFFAMGSNNPNLAARRASMSCRVGELAVLAKADLLGRICADKSRAMDNLELFVELAREDGIIDSPRAFPDANTRLEYFRGNGAISPDYPHFAKTGSDVTLLCGLPASGKDTWVSKNAQGLATVSFDDARRELGLDHGPKSGAAVHLAKDKAKALLAKGTPFVWNSTNLSRRVRTMTLDLLFAYKANVKIVYLEAPEDVVRKRNDERGGTLTNADLDKMLLRWEVPGADEAHGVDFEVLASNRKPKRVAR